MSVKSLQKQLIAAVAMVIVAAIAVSSSTFAWFASNNTVSATDMSVSVQSDAKFLEIRAASGTEGTFNATAPRTTVVAVNKGLDGEDNPIKLLPVKPVFNGNALQKWQYGYSDSVDSATVNAAGYTDLALDAANIDEYRLVNQFYVRSTVEGQNLTNLTVASVTADTSAVDDSIDEAVRVLVVGANGYAIWDAGTETLTTDQTLISTVNYDANLSGGQLVSVYVYYDGDDTALYTNNLSSLAGMTVNVAFEVE